MVGESGRRYIVVDKPTVAITELTKEEKSAKTVKIPSVVVVDGIEYSVTVISDAVFKNNKSVQSIVIPSSVTEIGDSCFEGCSALKSVTIGKNVITIGKKAFKNCKKLKKITFKSKKLESIGKSAFSGIHKKCVIKVPSSKLKEYQKMMKNKGQKSSVRIKK